MNNAQSTHAASVHQTVSDSAVRLKDRYCNTSYSKLPGAISEFQRYILSLPNNTIQNRAAKTGFQRISARDYRFTDPSSQLTIHQLLGLCWLAVNDKSNRVAQCSLDEAKNLLVQALYEIQRGYNLSETEPPVDNGEEDSPICVAGTFNKLMEKLNSIHRDIVILIITREAALSKLPRVVREEAHAYLVQLKQSKNHENNQAYLQLRESIKNGSDISVLFEIIKPKVLVRMFDDYGSLFQNQIQNAGFIELVNYGKYADLGNLSFLDTLVETDLLGAGMVPQTLLPLNTGSVSKNTNSNKNSGSSHTFFTNTNTETTDRAKVSKAEVDHFGEIVNLNT